MTCAACDRVLTADELGLSRKLINRGTRVFYCVPCLAEKYRVTESALRDMIERFRAAGCSLFPPTPCEPSHTNG